MHHSGQLDQDQDRDSVSRAGVEDLATFFATLFTCGALIAAQVIDVNVVKLIGQRLTETVG
ncbi:hypothetical protein GCM10010910_03880 [Microbacterium nanhaiense]|uniref:MFS transporter n=1 Tax=Microbacterium nanhaiense TaxID=1301026 RepID=A0ABQ2MXL6_9MICO|nr:hypothetical protein GCM10010910_03880 [Microbacterium nanhaiense]